MSLGAFWIYFLRRFSTNLFLQGEVVSLKPTPQNIQSCNFAQLSTVNTETTRQVKQIFTGWGKAAVA
jgi:hypothetical protein